MLLFTCVICLFMVTSASITFPNKQHLCSNDFEYLPADICSCYGATVSIGYIVVANCQCNPHYPVLSLKTVSGFVNHLMISHCQLILPTGVLDEISLRMLTLYNVTAHLRGTVIAKGSRARGLFLNITDSYIPTIPTEAFTGGVKRILIQNTIIKNISTFAFNKLSLSSTILKNVTIHLLEGYGINGVTSGYLEIKRCKFIELLPHALYINTQSIVKFADNYIGNVGKLSMVFGSPAKGLDIRKNTFDAITQLGIVATVKPEVDVVIAKNIFNYLTNDSLRAISSNQLHFVGNYIGSCEPTSLSFSPKIIELSAEYNIFNKTCYCEINEWAESVFSEYHNSTLILPKSLQSNIETSNFCVDITGKDRVITEFFEEKCTTDTSKQIVLIVVPIVVVLLVGLLVFSIVLLYRKRHQVKKQKQLLESHQNSFQYMTLTLPDPKKYKETQVEYVVEFVEEIPEKNPDLPPAQVRQSCPVISSSVSNTP